MSVSEGGKELAPADREARAIARNIRRLEQQAQQTIHKLNQGRNLLAELSEKVRDFENETSVLSGVEAMIGIVEGQPQDNFSDFVEKFTKVARGLGWTNQKMLDKLTTHLAEYALDEYQTLPPEAKTDFNTLVRELKARVTPPEHKRFSDLCLRGRTKKTNESITDYARSIKKLARAAFQDMEVGTQDYLAGATSTGKIISTAAIRQAILPITADIVDVRYHHPPVILRKH